MKLIENNNEIIDFKIGYKFFLYFIIANIIFIYIHAWVLNYSISVFIIVLLANIKLNILILKDTILIFRVLIAGYCIRINKESNEIQYFNRKFKKDYVNINEVIEFDIINLFNFYQNKAKVDYKKRPMFDYTGIRLYLNDGSYRDMFAKIMRNDYDTTIESLEQFFPNREKRLKQEMAK